MSFRQQLILGIGALIAMMMFCATMALATLWRSSTETSEVTSELVGQLESTHRIGVLSARLIASGRGYVLTANESERVLFASVADELSTALATVARDTSNPAEMVQLLRIRIAAERYVQRIHRLAEHADPMTTLYPDHLPSARRELEAAVRTFTRAQSEHAEELGRRSGERVRIAGIVLAVGSGLGTAIGIALAIVVSRRLFGEYTRGQHVARAATDAARARKELLDMVSHDLRSPLHSIMLGVDLMRQQHGGVTHLAVLEQAAIRMQKLVEGLLDASEAETTGLVLHREWTSIGVLFGSTLQLFGAHAERAGVNLRVARAPVEPVDVDRERLLQILSNLVSNALAFTPRGGEVTLDAVRDDSVVRIAVTDTGPGIPEHERGALFQSFRQAGQGREQKRSRRGSVGLGLYIARSLVIAHGGRIGVDSVEGGGSMFWFEIPCA